MGTPGLVLGVLVGLASLIPHASGIQASADDLMSHATHVHPFILALLGTVISGAVVIQGADFSEDFDNWFALPILELLSHLFSTGVGAVLGLSLFVKGPWGFWDCSAYFGIAVTLVILLAMALISTAGLSLVELRVIARTASHSSAKRARNKLPSSAVATKKQIRMFVVLTIGCLIALVYTAVAFPMPTSDVLHAGYARLAGFACTAH